MAKSKHMNIKPLKTETTMIQTGRLSMLSTEAIFLFESEAIDCLWLDYVFTGDSVFDPVLR